MGITSYPVIDLAATGENIIRLRKAKGYTVAELQEFFGFEAPQAIYKWQQGKTLPSTDNLFALSQFLGVRMEEILVAAKPKFQVLPQDDSCGSGFFGEKAVSAASFIGDQWKNIGCYLSAFLLYFRSGIHYSVCVPNGRYM